MASWAKRSNVDIGGQCGTSFLHQNFLLPFMCLPCPDEEDESEVPELPQGNQVVNSLEEMQSVDAILDLSSDPGSEAAYDGGISGNSSYLSSSETGKQKISIGP